MVFSQGDVSGYPPGMNLKLNNHDSDLCVTAIEVIRSAVKHAEVPQAVAKKIAAAAVRLRNKGRAAAIKSHPFQGVCEATGMPLDSVDKVLDEMDPEMGYSGKVRWICPKCNNSGKRSCISGVSPRNRTKLA